jgi:hypothetical protein
LPRTTSKNPKPNYKDFPNNAAGYRAYDRALAGWSRRQQSERNLGPRPRRANFKTGEAYRKALIAYVKKKNG